MVSKLSIDYREYNIIDKIKDIEFKYTIDNLPIGDFIIYKDDSIKLIIERKTFLDLAASITDGRFREQKKRLLESNVKILYIIEGVKNSVCNKLRHACNGALQNLIYKYGINIIYTYDVDDTIDNIKMLLKKIDKDDILVEDVNQNNSLSTNTPKLFSKSDKVNQNIFSLQLSVIPGISLNIANKINDEYGNMKALIEYIYENGEESLSDIQITEKRKLGKANSKKIYNCLIK